MPSYNEPVELGTILRRHRVALKLTQKDVGERLGVKQATVARWESGRRPEPEYFDGIAGFLELPRDDVLRFAHQAAEDDGLGDEIIAAHGGRWYYLPIERRRDIARQILQLLEDQ